MAPPGDEARRRKVAVVGGEVRVRRRGEGRRGVGDRGAGGALADSQVVAGRRRGAVRRAGKRRRRGQRGRLLDPEVAVEEVEDLVRLAALERKHACPRRATAPGLEGEQLSIETVSKTIRDKETSTSPYSDISV